MQPRLILQPESHDKCVGLIFQRLLHIRIGQIGILGHDEKAMQSVSCILMLIKCRSSLHEGIK